MARIAILAAKAARSRGIATVAVDAMTTGILDVGTTNPRANPVGTESRGKRSIFAKTESGSLDRVTV